MQFNWRSWIFPCLLIIAGLFVPAVVANAYYIHVIIMGFIWAIAVYGLNIILGYTGQLSLGHAGFMGLGAYTVALMSLKLGAPFWLAMACAVLLNIVTSWLLSFIAFRTRDHYFAIFTLAIGVILHHVMEKWEKLTNGNNGLSQIPGFGGIGPISFDTAAARYYLIYAFLLLAIYVSWSLKHSLIGRTLMAIRNSEDLAKSIGIPVNRGKRLAFMISAALTGMAGGLYAGYIGFLGPSIASITVTFNLLLYLLVGGIGTVAGPLIGSFIVSVLTQFLVVLQDYQMLIFGPVLVLLTIFFPHGLAGGYYKLKHRWRTASANRKGKAEPAPGRAGGAAMAEASGVAEVSGAAEISVAAEASDAAEASGTAGAKGAVHREVR